MYRIIGRNGVYYAAWMNTIDDPDEIENLENFVSEGDAVLLVNEIEDAKNFGITEDQIEIV